MEILNKDMLFRLGMELNTPNLLKLCELDKRFNDKVCKNDDIWYFKIKNEFPYSKDFKNELSPREKYILLYSLRDLKEKLKRTETIYELYRLKIIYLNNKLTKIPVSLGNLSNLKKLYLHNNQFKKTLFA